MDFPAEHFRGRGVYERRVAVSIQAIDPFPHGIQDHFILSAQPFQHLLGMFLVRDVRQHSDKMCDLPHGGMYRRDYHVVPSR